MEKYSNFLDQAFKALEGYDIKLDEIALTEADDNIESTILDLFKKESSYSVIHDFDIDGVSYSLYIEATCDGDSCDAIFGEFDEENIDGIIVDVLDGERNFVGTLHEMSLDTPVAEAEEKAHSVINGESEIKDIVVPETSDEEEASSEEEPESNTRLFVHEEGDELGDETSPEEVETTEIEIGGESPEIGSVEEKLNESTTFNLLDDDEKEEASKILTDNEEKEPVEQIVDINAESKEDLKKTYIGSAILQCGTCKTMIYKNIEDLVKSEGEENIYNVDEECPHCGSKDGYELIGQVATLDVNPEATPEAPVEEKQEEQEVEHEENTQELPEEQEEAEEKVEEELDINDKERTNIYYIDLKGKDDSWLSGNVLDKGDCGFGGFYSKEEASKIYNDIESLIDLSNKELIKKGHSEGEEEFIPVEVYLMFAPIEGEDFDEDGGDSDNEEIEHRAFEDKKKGLNEEVQDSPEEQESTDDVEGNQEEDVAVVKTVEEKSEDVDVKVDVVIQGAEGVDNEKLVTAVEEVIADTETVGNDEKIVTDVFVANEEERKEEVKEPIESEKEFELDSFDESIYDRLINRYLHETYFNTRKYKTVAASVDNEHNTIVIEGKITFKSGVEKDTKFIFEAKELTKKGKVKFSGINEMFSDKKSFTLVGTLNENKLLSESLSYNYKINDRKVSGKVLAPNRK